MTATELEKELIAKVGELHAEDRVLDTRLDTVEQKATAAVTA